MLEALLKGVTLGLLLSISVGPVIFSIIKQSLSSGHKGGMAFVLGVSFSDLTLVLISNVFTQFFKNISAHQTLIGIAGSSLLVAMGIFYLFFKKIRFSDRTSLKNRRIKKRDYLRLFFSGYFMNILNPAVFFFWLSASTTFIVNTIDERILLFSTALLLIFFGDIAKVMLAAKIRNKLTPRNILIINRVNGVILLLFGALLIGGLIFYSE